MTERERIEKMLAEGKITPAEAERLVQAIGRLQSKEAAGAPGDGSGGTETTVGRNARIVPGTSPKIMDKLRLMLAAANCEVTEESPNALRFRHGTFMTESAPLLAKKGRIVLSDRGDSTLVSYDIKVAGFARYWMTFVAIVFFWAIFPPILVHRALVYYPRRFMENLLAGL